MNNVSRPLSLFFMLLLSAAMLPAPVRAASGEPAAPPILRLDAEASREIDQDSAIAVFFIEREGPKAAQIQSEINATISDVIKALKGDPQLKVRSGTYRTYPRHSRDGKIQSWSTRAEVIVESTDIEAVSRATTTAAASMNVGSISFALSSARRKEVEQALMQEAAENFHARARNAAKALGFSSVELIEASYNKPSMPPIPLARTMAVSASLNSAAPAVPMHAGQSTVTVSFSGSFRLKN